LIDSETLRANVAQGESIEEFKVVTALRDHFEAGHLHPLLESRHIPTMVVGGREGPLHAGWVDHAGTAFGVLMVPQERLSEASVLVQSFREELAAQGEVDEEALAREALLDPQGEERVERGEASFKSSVYELGALWSLWVRCLASLSLLLVAILSLRVGRGVASMLLFSLALMNLSRLPDSLRLDKKRATIWRWAIKDRLLGRPPEHHSLNGLLRLRLSLSPKNNRLELWLEGEDSRALLLNSRRSGPTFRRAEEIAGFLGLPLVADQELSE